MYAVSLEKKNKLTIDAMLYFMDGTMATGTLFVDTNQRISDLMNEGRKFLPFLNRDGGFEMINKDTISKVRPCKSKGE